MDEFSRMLRLLEDRLEKLESLEQRLKRFLSSPSSSAAATRRPLICYYCHHKGHGTACCSVLQRDKEDDLIKQKGQNFFLPSGALIPFDPSRPIRSVVVLFQATSSSPDPVNHLPYRTSCGNLKRRYPPVAPPPPLSHAHVSDPTRKKGPEPTFLRVLSNFQPHPRRPIRKSPVPESNQSEAACLPCCTPSAQAVDSVLKKISKIISPGLLVSKPPRRKSPTSASVAIALPTAEKMNNWISLRCIKIGSQEVK
ncbi:hypothetical protein PTTG_29010, partial [Puccinia triticina 1-1 BBBD Race 1]